MVLVLEIIVPIAGVLALIYLIADRTLSAPRYYGPITEQDLPPIDTVLISHNHYDHLDIQTLVRLNTEHRPRFVTGLGNRAFLNVRGIIDVSELDWWESAKVSNELGVICVPA